MLGKESYKEAVEMLVGEIWQSGIVSTSAFAEGRNIYIYIRRHEYTDW